MSANSQLRQPTLLEGEDQEHCGLLASEDKFEHGVEPDANLTIRRPKDDREVFYLRLVAVLSLGLNLTLLAVCFSLTVMGDWRMASSKTDLYTNCEHESLRVLWRIQC